MLPGGSRQGDARGDEIVGLYSAMGFNTDELAAELHRNPSLALPPEMHENAEDQAIYFFDSLTSARAMDLDEARATWCRYEDGTPSRWQSGHADCFGDHESFSERLERALQATDRSLPVEARLTAARQAACDGVRPPQNASFSAITAQRICSSLER